MADDYTAKDAAGATKTFSAKEVASKLLPRHIAVDETNTAIAMATSAKQDAAATLLGAVNETAPASDTASSGLNGRLQRIAQNITSLIAATLTAVGNVASGASDSGNPVKVGGRYNSTKPTFTDGQRGDAQLDSRGGIMTVIKGENSTASAAVVASADGRSASVALAVEAQNNLFNGSTWDRQRKPNTASRIPSAAASTNATSAKASAGDVHVISGYNASGAVRYLKFYNKASTPTVGSDTVVLTLALPTGAFSFNLNAHYFSTGIAYAMTTGAADADTGALSSGDVLGLTITYH
jgi:hypothetical protein